MEYTSAFLLIANPAAGMFSMSLPADATLDDVQVRIREAYSNPNVGNISQVVLKDGPQTFRIATLLEIINRDETESFHRPDHHS